MGRPPVPVRMVAGDLSRALNPHPEGDVNLIPRLRTRARSGQWLALHGSLTEPSLDSPSETVIVIGPAKPEEVAWLNVAASGLSPREEEVLRLVVRGLSNRQIFQRLFIPENTVQQHLQDAFERSGLRGAEVGRFGPDVRPLLSSAAALCHRDHAAGSPPSSVSTASLGGKDEPVLFAETHHAVEIELYPVAGVKAYSRLTVHRLRTLGSLLEEVLESSRGDDLQDPARSFPGVPEGMPLASGLEDEVPLSRVHDIVAELRSQASLEDVAVLVLV
jgi:hypothetical protein